MERWMGKYSEIFYSVMRIVMGLLFACHGAQKLFGLFGTQGSASGPLMITAGIIEFFGGILVALGLWTGYAAFLASGQMAVAYFMVHATQDLWPINNDGELSVLYCFAFLFMASKGSGRLSVAGLTKRRYR
jgi:putative oxidoreductase